MIRRRVSIETKINHERWLVSYSDFITLLFAFFVVMYSVSQVSEQKYRVLSDTLQSAFSSNAQSPIGKEQSEFESLASIQQLETELIEALKGLIDSGSLSVWGNEDWVEIELNANVLFSSGSAEPSSEATRIFSDVANILSPYENAVEVSGHTDNVPIRNGDFANNWELSSARAVAVVNMLAYGGVNPERLSATGYGEYRPLADNSTEEGRAANRRVVLRVARSKAEAPREGAESLMTESGNRLPPAGDGQTLNDGTETTENSDTVVEQSTEQPPQVQPDAETIAPIKLPNGGLLFTSDPKGRGEPKR